MLTYKDAGVDIDEATRAKRLFAERVAATYTGVPGVTVSTFGQFAALVQFDDLPSVAFGFTGDGLGTKLRLCIRHKRWSVIGRCLVAHCVNDLLTAGIKARVLLDYVATAGLDAETAAEIVSSLADACRELRIVLAGGELAEMPGVYQPSEWDCVAFAQGTVDPRRIVNSSSVRPGDPIFFLPSSGPGCNGYSLIQRVLVDVDLDKPCEGYDGKSWLDVILEPSRCYAEEIHRALSARCGIHGMANITGGGIPGNLSRILPDGCYASLDQGVIEERIPPIFRHIQRIGDVPWSDMIKTFNIGVGYMVITCDNPSSGAVEGEHSFERFGGRDVVRVGSVVSGDGPKVRFTGDWGSF